MIDIDLTVISDDDFNVIINDIGDVEINFGWGTVKLTYDQFEKLKNSIKDF